VGDPEDRRLDLHLAPVAEGDPGEQRPRIHDERDRSGDGGRDGCRVPCERRRAAPNQRGQAFAASIAAIFARRWR
ncbi:MAG TPA: hypothetical protein VKA85_07920, partial [Candidatus Limnocylindrales bacterium]|nr:hypothetical protein [Candidatus Limnocylindrales bacterium]